MTRIDRRKLGRRFLPGLAMVSLVLLGCSAWAGPEGRSASPGNGVEGKGEASVPSDLAVSGRTMQARVYSDIEADDPWLEMAQRDLFGQVWTRPGLTVKERRLISLTTAAAVGSQPGYAAHLRGALESGDLSEEELWEWLIHFTQYAGYFKAAPVWSEYRLLLAERGSMPLPAKGVDPKRLRGDP